MSLRIELQEAGGPSTRVQLKAGVYRLGRDAQYCELTFRGELVSRIHAALVGEGDHWWVLDLGSSNGIVLNGRPAYRGQIHPGDRIAFGDVDLVVLPREEESDPGAEVQELATAPPMRYRGERPPVEEYSLPGVEELSRRLAGGGGSRETRIACLVEAGARLRSLAAREDGAEAACALIRGVLACDRVLLFRGEGPFREPAAADRSDPGEELSPLVRRMVEVALEEGEVLLTPRIGRDRRFRGGRDREGYDAGPALAGPLRFRDRPLGVVYLDHRLEGGWFEEEDRLFLQDLLDRLAEGLALGEARRARVG